MRRMMIAAALLAATGCKPTQLSGADHILSAISKAMPPCPTSMQVTSVVRVIIPSPFDPASVKRDVKYKNPTPNDDNDQANQNGTDDVINPVTPFGIDLKQIGKPGRSYAMIRIILKDSRYSFFKWIDADGKEVDGVGSGDVTNPMQFCGAEIRTSPMVRWPVAVFYAQFRQSSGKPDILQSYNIGVESSQNVGTPLFIDPSIKNNG